MDFLLGGFEAVHGPLSDEEKALQEELEILIRILMDMPEDEIRRRFLEHEHRSKIERLERIFRLRKYLEETGRKQREWEQSTIEDVRWHRIIHHGLAVAYPDMKGTEYRYYRALLEDVYRLGIIGVEGAINNKTSNCLEQNKVLKRKINQLKAENRVLREKLKAQ